jgi:hypothetical protein
MGPDRPLDFGVSGSEEVSEAMFPGRVCNPSGTATAKGHPSGWA